jgi:hypothetical protein
MTAHRPPRHTTAISRRRWLAGAAAAAAAAQFPAPLALCAAEAKWGDVCGRLVFDGTPPERAKLKVDKDLECCGKFDIRDESLMVGTEGGLQNVFVYVRTPKIAVCPELAEAAAKRVTLDNRDCIFQPHCLTIWCDQQEFYTVNSDPVAQNIAFSPLGDAPANVILPVKGDATYKFARQQSAPVPIACNYHPWESAFILPRDNPYAAITRPDGAFRIARLPVGPLELQFWHERVKQLDTPQWPKGRLSVTVQPGTNDLGTIKIAPASLVKQA